MRIVIDLQGAQTESRFRGIGFYSLSIVKAIIRNKGEHEVIIALNGLFPATIETIREEFRELLPQENIRVWYAPGPVCERMPENSWRRKVAEFIREAFLASLQPDIIYITSLFEGHIDDAVTSIGCLDRTTPVCTSLYDLIPLLNPKDYLQPDQVFEQYYLRKLEHLQQSSLLLSISDFSRTEGLTHLGFDSESIVNISTAADQKFKVQSLNKQQKLCLFEKFNLHQSFVLCSGGADARKNLPRLIRAYAQLPAKIRNNHQLVFTGKMPESYIQHLKQVAKNAGLSSDEFVILGFVSSDDLVKLYNLCKLYVFPSFHEGFGLPALEAMSCGAPVIGANTTSLPEVIGYKEALFDPLSEKEISEKIEKALTDDLFLKELIKHGNKQARKFSWDNSAVTAIAAFEKLHHRQKKTNDIQSVRDRPKMAFISPLPPERSGISDYSAELVPELSKYYDIDVIVAQESVDDPWINDNCQIHDVEWLRNNVFLYERILYHFGNSHYHQHMPGLLREIPGIVVLHDFFLSGPLYHSEFKKNDPHGWINELYISHGYKAVQESFEAEDPHDVMMKYPCNFSVLRDAKGIIVHSEHSRQLAKSWYSNNEACDWSVIPLLREPANNHDRKVARDILKIDYNDFVICSFGTVDPTKLSLRLLEAWLSSDLATKENCKLIFVGENHYGQYGQDIIVAVKHSGLEKQIHITGWVDRKTFQYYLAAADIGVQLRSLSRGETSATVLDCMNYGLPTIVNAHGSMAALPGDTVLMLEDDFDDAQLIEALEKLWGDIAYRDTLSRKAENYIKTKHLPKKCAEQYFEAIEKFYKKAQSDRHSLISAIASLDASQPNDKECIKLARSIAQSIPDKLPEKQLFLDITATCQNNLNTGIERVAHSLLMELTQKPPKGYRIEPIYLTDTDGLLNYRYARSYTCSLLGIPNKQMQDDVVTFRPGDILFSSDYAADMVTRAEQSGVYAFIKQNGVKLYFMVHDLMPVFMEQYFPPKSSHIFESWLKSICRISDGIICVSRTVANDLNYWWSRQSINREINLYWSHHGADIQPLHLNNSVISKKEHKQLNLIRSRPTFLMVGTIEPRKGYLQALEAFDLVWKNGIDVNLVIVGTEGWQGLENEQRRNIPEIVDKFKYHPELNRHFIWLENAGDEMLRQVYSASTCLIAASEGEGFGLPLIEAAQKKLPIIARDIPVFKEVAQEHAYYFSGFLPENLADAVVDWLNLYKDDKHVKSSNMPWLTWNISASHLGEIICNENNNLDSHLSIGKCEKFLEKDAKRIFVDITVVFKNDFKTGIQRVTRSILHALLEQSLPGYKVIPVYLSRENNTWSYKSASSYITKYMPELKRPGNIRDDYISIGNSDILLGLDLAGSYVVSAAKQSLYTQLKNRGARVYFIVHDLLPLSMPEYFSKADTEGHTKWLHATTQGNGVICVSETTKNEYRKWLSNNKGEAGEEFSIQSFHEGADIENSLPSKGFTHDDSLVIDKIEQRISFLQVGTLEPRKGHVQTLSAFEQLWSDGLDINLVIVGKKGWMMDDFANILRCHPLRNKKLFWLEGISDEYLEKVYNSVDCLIAASEGEGFGLPLIEAASYDLPIIARDIPVFREVAGDHAYFFDGKEGKALAKTIIEWLSLFKADKHPKSGGLPYLSWEQSTKELLEILIS